MQDRDVEGSLGLPEKYAIKLRKRPALVTATDDRKLFVDADDVFLSILARYSVTI